MNRFSFDAEEERPPADGLFAMMMGMTPEQWDALGAEDDEAFDAEPF